MGKQSRRKRARRESPESVAFRVAMAEEYFAEMLRQIPAHVDMATLQALADCRFAVADGVRLLPLLIPRQTYTDHMEFDRSMCRTGLTEFFRRTMPSDYPQGPGLNAQGEPDPSIPIPAMDWGEFLRVIELAPGIRTKRSVEIKTMVAPP